MSKQNWMYSSNQDGGRPRHKRKTPWCKGKEGLYHERVRTLLPGKICGPALTYTAQGKYESWICNHIITCSRCGKTIADYSVSERCPDNPNRKEGHDQPDPEGS